MVAYGSHVIGNLIFLNLPTNQWINPQVRQIKKYLPIGYAVFDEIYAEKKKLIAKNGEDDEEDVLSVMIKRNLPKSKFYEHMTTLACAGFETTAHFGAYT